MWQGASASTAVFHLKLRYCMKTLGALMDAGGAGAQGAQGARARVGRGCDS